MCLRYCLFLQTPTRFGLTSLPLVYIHKCDLIAIAQEHTEPLREDISHPNLSNQRQSIPLSSNQLFKIPVKLAIIVAKVYNLFNGFCVCIFLSPCIVLQNKKPAKAGSIQSTLPKAKQFQQT